MTRSTDTASGSSGKRTLAEVFAAGMAASLRAQGLHEEADAVVAKIVVVMALRISAPGP